MSHPQLGLRANLSQFSLLVLVNAFVGAMVGMERSILPAIAEQEFHLAAKVAVLSFIVVFGVTKALTNYLAGRLADSFGGGMCARTPGPRPARRRRSTPTCRADRRLRVRWPAGTRAATCRRVWRSTG